MFEQCFLNRKKCHRNEALEEKIDYEDEKGYRHSAQHCIGAGVDLGDEFDGFGD